MKFPLFSKKSEEDERKIIARAELQEAINDCRYLINQLNKILSDKKAKETRMQFDKILHNLQDADAFLKEINESNKSTVIEELNKAQKDIDSKPFNQNIKDLANQQIISKLDESRIISIRAKISKLTGSVQKFNF